MHSLDTKAISLAVYEEKQLHKPGANNQFQPTMTRIYLFQTSPIMNRPNTFRVDPINCLQRKEWELLNKSEDRECWRFSISPSWQYAVQSRGRCILNIFTNVRMPAISGGLRGNDHNIVPGSLCGEWGWGWGYYFEHNDISDVTARLWILPSTQV